MKLRIQSTTVSAFTLIECIVYISVLMIVLGLASMAFYRCWDDNKSITRNGNDIVRTVKAGETWRADLRAATGPIQITTTNSKQTLRIPCNGKQTIYSFANNEVRRQTTLNGPSQILLPKVKSSAMQIDKRAQVTAWRWEVELESVNQKARTRPLFSFEAVAGTSSVQ